MQSNATCAEISQALSCLQIWPWWPPFVQWNSSSKGKKHMIIIISRDSNVSRIEPERTLKYIIGGGEEFCKSSWQAHNYCTRSEDSIASEMDYCEGEIFRVGHTWCQLWATSASGRPRQRGLGNIQSSDIAMGMDLLTIHVSLYLLCHGFSLVIIGGWDFLIW